VLNASGRDGEARAARRAFDELGFATLGTGNVERQDETEVRYAPGAEDQGRAVLRYIKPAARLVEDPDLRRTDVAVVLGRDFSKILVPTYATSTTTPETGAPDAVPVGGAPTTAPSMTSPTTAARGSDSTTVTTLTPAPILDQEEIGFPAPLNPPC